MTRMFPAQPNRDSTKSERRIFEIIRRVPGSESWICLNSVGLARHNRKAYGEADFVLICPYGVFCLEVKGGQVHRKDGTWTIGWPGSQYRSTEGPFKQAQGTIHPLIEEIGNRISPEFRKGVPVGWGVVFPDIVFTMEDPEWSLNCVCDSRHLGDFRSYIKRLAVHTRQRAAVAGRQYPETVGQNDCQRILDCFRRDFDLVPRVRELLAESQRELVELSEQQYAVLRYALDPNNPRVLCPGGAGTGKTLIALEAARRLAREGKSVLFLCFNRLLGEYLASEIEPDIGRVEVWSLHQFMRHMISEAGLRDRLREEEHGAADPSRLFNESYPDLFETAVLELVDQKEFSRFDALILDEGQDILFSPTIDAIGMCLSGGLTEGKWVVLFDPGLQSEIYGRMDDRVLETLNACHPVRLGLYENFRNPEPVIEEMCHLIGLEKPVCRRQLQVRVDYRSYATTEEQAKKLRALLVELIREGVSPGSITVLSGCRRELSCIQKFPPDVGKPVRFLDGTTSSASNPDAITASTVSSFKGMENEIIILTDISVPGPDQAWDRSIAYVGMTRAQTNVYALVSKEFLMFRERCQSTGREEKNA